MMMSSKELLAPVFFVASSSCRASAKFSRSLFTHSYWANCASFLLVLRLPISSQPLGIGTEPIKLAATRQQLP